MNPVTMALALSGVILAGTIVSVEAGFRWGLRDAHTNAKLSHEGVTAVEAAAYGLLGLLLAFSFAGATNRLEVKRQLVVDEANAIGTAYLRVDLLAAEAQPPIRREFKRLIDAGWTPVASSPAEARSRARADLERFGIAAKAIDLKPN
jgi:hypothetical protein